MRRTLILSAALVACLWGAPAWADVLQVIPYDGLLRHGGAPIDGARAMRFLLYDADGAEIWRAERSDEPASSCGGPCQVTFYRGEFSVMLGRHAPLPEAALSAPSLGLGLEIRREDGEWIALRGRQTITPAPFALWTQRGDDLEVGGDLTTPRLNVGGALTVEGGAPSISGGLTVSGALTAGALSIAGTLTAGLLSTRGALRLTGGALEISGGALEFGPSQDHGDGGVALAHASENRLQLNPGGGFTGGVRVRGGYLLTHGGITVDNQLLVASGEVNWGLLAGGRLQVNRPLAVVRHIDMGLEGRVDTGFAASDYLCGMAGWLMMRGDIYEGGGTHIGEAYTYIRDGNWWVAVDFASHGEHEAHHAIVICFQSTMSDGESGWVDL